MRQLLKTALRIWITLTSLGSFLGGWIMLVHAPKPVSQTGGQAGATSLPTLEPLPPLSGNEFNDPNQNDVTFGFQPAPRFNPGPFFRTGGS